MSEPLSAWRVPVIDVSRLVRGDPRSEGVAGEIQRACRDTGFFYVVGHGVDARLVARLEELSRRFFALDRDTKMKIRMSLGGRAWRGYFPVGGELTSGVPDDKEGIYFGSELSADDARVQSGTPMHGRNLFPDVAGFRACVLEYIASLTKLGHALMRGIALSLELEPDYFQRRYTADPLILFRIFNYPAVRRAAASPNWGVGEHTDYGLLTILKQDDVGGLEVKSRHGWVAAPPIEGSFVCNIGDMLDRMTRGLYRSTPHRAANRTDKDRLSLAFFFDPSFDAQVQPIETRATARLVDDRDERWDRASVHEFSGTYGDYLLSKVSKVFPELRREQL
jgi:isopenicillin N synthase-like dioxygenase